MTLNDIATYFADNIQEWHRIRDKLQAKLIEAFHAVENGNTDPFAGDSRLPPVPSHIRRDFVDYCKRGIYVIDPDSGIVWDTQNNCSAVASFVTGNYDPMVTAIDSLMEMYYNYLDCRDWLIDTIDSHLQDLTKDFGDYLKENYGVDTDNPVITDQVLYFVICAVTRESLLTYLEHDFVSELFDEWARDFILD